MYYLLQVDTSEIFDVQTILFGEENWKFIFQVMVRSVIMFLVSLTTLRLLGKRGIKQGVFEVVVIITLGSAAGDAMFYSNVGLVPAILVFIMIILLYKLTNYLVAQNKFFQSIIEGHPQACRRWKILLSCDKNQTCYLFVRVLCKYRGTGARYQKVM